MVSDQGDFFAFDEWLELDQAFFGGKGFPLCRGVPLFHFLECSGPIGDNAFHLYVRII